MPFYTGGPDVLPAVQAEGLAGQQTSWVQNHYDLTVGILLLLLTLAFAGIVAILLIAGINKVKAEAEKAELETEER